MNGKDDAPQHVCVVMPVLDDWLAANALVASLDRELAKAGLVASVLAIDDGSILAGEGHRPRNGQNAILTVRNVRLRRNVGHQRAIAIGLGVAAAEYPGADVVVMDSDGEDRPEDLITLIRIAQETPDAVVFAQRTKRSETFAFRFFYLIYKWLFVALTGKPISFGNFCVIPATLLGRIVFLAEVWNHFSAGIMKARLPYVAVPTQRGRRLSGNSKMNFVSLAVHGLSALSVHVEVIAVRVLVASVFLMASALVGIAVVAGIRLFTDLAIPGWASGTVAGLAIVFLQACMMSLLLGFSMLHYRMQPDFIPARDCNIYILSISEDP